MSISHRFKTLLKEERITQSAFCLEIEFSIRSLSHFLMGRTKYPRMDFVMKIMKHRPQWNWRWIFFGEGEKYLPDKELDKVEEPIVGYQPKQDSVINSLVMQLDYMREENLGLKKELSSLKL